MSIAGIAVIASALVAVVSVVFHARLSYRVVPRGAARRHPWVCPTCGFPCGACNGVGAAGWLVAPAEPGAKDGEEQSR
jgi:hypothetical protein